MPPRGNMRMPAKPKNARGTLRRLMKELGAHKAKLIVVALCIAISTGCSTFGTYLLKDAINVYIQPLRQQFSEAGAMPDLSGFIRFLGMMLMVYLIGAFSTFLYSRLMMLASTGILNKLRKEMFDHMEDLPIRYFDQHTHGEIMSRYTNDTDTLREFFSSTFPQNISSFLSICFSLFFLLRLNGWLTLLLVVLMPLMTLLTKNLGKKAGANFVAQQKAVGALNGYIEETIEGQRVVQVFCHEEKAKEAFDGLNENVREAGTRANTFAGMMGPIMNNLSHCYYVLITLLGSILIVMGQTDVGTLVAFLPMIRQFTQPISNVAQQFNTIMQALAGAERVFELMDEPAEEDHGYVTLVNAHKDAQGNITESEARTGLWAWKHPHGDGTTTYTELKGDVVFEDVTFGYVPDKIVLHNISLYAKPGQKIAFVGSTGAGKTTITNLINRFYDIQSGYAPVHRHRAGQHPLWQAGRHGRGNRAGGQGGQRGLLHPSSAPGL